MSWLDFIFNPCKTQKQNIKVLKQLNLKLINSIGNCQQQKTNLIKENNKQKIDIEILQEILKNYKNNKNSFKTNLPSCFKKTINTYYGNCTVITKLQEKNWKYSKASDSLELTPMWDKYLLACNIKSNDSALQVFNKILATEQRLIAYVSDLKQWGKAESWQRPSIEWITKQSDCENGSTLVNSVFEYYELLNGRFPNTIVFTATGKYNRKYGHAFPCILLNSNSINSIKDLKENLFIGESTLDAEIPARQLKLVEQHYDMSTGGFNFLFDFILKGEFKWW